MVPKGSPERTLDTLFVESACAPHVECLTHVETVEKETDGSFVLGVDTVPGIEEDRLGRGDKEDHVVTVGTVDAKRDLNGKQTGPRHRTIQLVDEPIASANDVENHNREGIAQTLAGEAEALDQSSLFTSIIARPGLPVHTTDGRHRVEKGIPKNVRIAFSTRLCFFPYE